MNEKEELLTKEFEFEASIDIFIGEPSLEDEYKIKHFADVRRQYSLQELEKLLPDKEA
jgi:hypothetical protein